ncbi:MAG: sugar-binding protein, partial [Bacteroidales bacterium]
MNKIIFIAGLITLMLTGCTGFRPFNDEEAIKIMINQEDQVVVGNDLWEGSSDCSAKAYLNKTSSTLLFTIEVFDDSLRTGAAQSYMNDGVELYFDFRPPRLR